MTMDDYRFFLKDCIRLQTDFRNTDQNRGVSMPPIEKPYPPEAEMILLPDWEECFRDKAPTLMDVIAQRMSRRQFSEAPVTLAELSFLLWSTQGVRANPASGIILRNVPSAGNRHSIETYLAIQQVSGLASGLYRYLPLRHALLPLGRVENFSERITEAALGQRFVGRAPVTFFWSTIPYRMEWRYAVASHKVIALDAGHVCQNLYLAAQAINCGTCAVAAYDQDAADRLLGLDGQEEFVIYLAPVGHIRG